MSAPATIAPEAHATVGPIIIVDNVRYTYGKGAVVALDGPEFPRHHHIAALRQRIGPDLFGNALADAAKVHAG